MNTDTNIFFDTDVKQKHTIDGLYDAAVKMSTKNFDQRCDFEDLAIVESGELADLAYVRAKQHFLFGEASAPPMPMTRHALGQLMSAMRVRNGAAYLYDSIMPNFPGSAGHQLNNLINSPFAKTLKGRDRQLLVRARDDNNGGVLRAILSSSYVPIDSHEILAVAKEHLDNLANMSGARELMDTMRQQFGSKIDFRITDQTPGGGIGHHVLRSYLTPDGLSAKIVLGITCTLPNEEEFSPAMFIKTSDIGGTAIHIMAGVVRLVCKNGMRAFVSRKDNSEMYKAEGWAPIMQHRWGSKDVIIARVHQAVSHALFSGTDMLNKVMLAQLRNLPTAAEVLLRMVTNVAPKDEREAIMLQAGAGMERQMTAMGIINGLTAAAQTPGINVDLADELEALGGAALDINLEAEDGAVAMQFFRLAGQKMIHSEVLAE